MNCFPLPSKKLNTSWNIELYFERGNSAKFTTLVRELESSGTMAQSKVTVLILAFNRLRNSLFMFQSYPFEFSTEKPYESYSGMNVRLRYFIRVTVSRSYSNCVKESEFLVQNYANVSLIIPLASAIICTLILRLKLKRLLLRL